MIRVQLSRLVPVIAVLTATVGTARTADGSEEAPTVAVCVQRAEHAQELRAAGNVSAARTALEFCSQAACPEVVRRDCTTWAEELAEASGQLIIQAVDEFGDPVSALFVLLDGEEAPLDEGRIAVPPGTHVLRIEAEDRLAVLKTVQVPENGKTVVKAVLLPVSDSSPRAPSPPPSVPRNVQAAPDEDSPSRPVWPWLAASVAVVGAGGFAYFGITGQAEANDLRASCGANKSCSEREVDAVRERLTVADVSLGVGLVSAGVAIWGFLSAPAAAVEADASSQALPLRKVPVLTGHDNTVVARWHF